MYVEDALYISVLYNVLARVKAFVVYILIRIIQIEQAKCHWYE